MARHSSGESDQDGLGGETLFHTTHKGPNFPLEGKQGQLEGDVGEFENAVDNQW